MLHSSAEGITAIVDYQRELLRREFAAFLKPGDRYALVDFPDHSNVGDSAIWLGETKLLCHIAGQLPHYVCTHQNYDRSALETAVPTGPIFIHGGGNIGDLWPANQQFRERILDDFPDRQVVLLPSSIHFLDERKIDGFNCALAKSKSPHLFVRDRPSLTIAQKWIDCPSTLSPDAAIGLGVMVQPQDAIIKAFALLRTDLEATGADYSALIQAGIVIDDWLNEPAINRTKLRNRAVIATIKGGNFSYGLAKAHHYNMIAQTRVDRGLKQLCQGEVVISDRLHAHILCTLMGKAHVALDNSYGKVSGYWENWHRGVPNIRFAHDVSEIAAALKELGQDELARAIAAGK